MSGLAEAARALSLSLEFAERPEPVDGSKLQGDDPNLMTRIRVRMAEGGELLEGRAATGLGVLVDLSGAETGFITNEDRLLACRGVHAPRQELIDVAVKRLRAAVAQDETAAIAHSDIKTDTESTTFDGVYYYSIPLWSERTLCEVPVAMLTLSFGVRAPRLPHPEVLQLVAGYLAG